MDFIKTPIRRGFTEIEALHSLLEDRGVICGGYARYCASSRLSPMPTSDVDVYAYTDDDFDYLVGFINRYLPKKRENPVSFIFERVTSGPLAFMPEINLIKPMRKGRVITVGDASTVLGNFDFTIARAAILDRDEALVDVDFHADEETLRLRLKNIHCPISSTLRCAKYVAKGYWLRPYDVLGLFEDWDARGEDYRSELIEALNEMEKAILEKQMLPQERISAVYELMAVD